MIKIAFSKDYPTARRLWESAYGVDYIYSIVKACSNGRLVVTHETDEATGYVQTQLGFLQGLTVDGGRIRYQVLVPVLPDGFSTVLGFEHVKIVPTAECPVVDGAVGKVLTGVSRIIDEDGNTHVVLKYSDRSEQGLENGVVESEHIKIEVEANEQT